MDKKKKLLLILIGIWIIVFIIMQFNGGEVKTVTVNKQGLNQKTMKESKIKPSETLKYPEITLNITKKDLFGELIRPDLEQKKKETEKKKLVSIQAPPMPILPEEPKPVAKEKEESIDEMKDIILMGIFRKDGKKMAFFKKNRDIKSFQRDEKLFNTSLKIAEIEENSVILIDGKGKKLTLTVEKEVKDAKEIKK